MTRLERFRLKNRLLFYNIFTNLIGVWIVLILSFRSISPPFYVIADFAHRINVIAIPVLVGLIAMLQIAYERPIRKVLCAMDVDRPVNANMMIQAKRRLLNIPFVVVGMDLSAWLAAAVIYMTLYKAFTGIGLAAHRVFFQNTLVGLIASTAAFFVLEQTVQKKLAPFFFPDGGLYMTPKTIRVRIGTRLTALILAVNLIPFAALLILVQGTYGIGLSPGLLLDHIRSSVITNSVISISVGLCLTVLVSLNFSRPLQGIIAALKRIREGRLDGHVTVTTNDELGYTGDVINEMTQGLKEREQMKQSLELAQEVQQNLLPRQSPSVKGLDIAGASLYCDETGGDYYDYIVSHDQECETLRVVIGDVSDHGIPSALLMTTARALIRLRTSFSGSLAGLVADVNRHLTMDIEDGGQFMTLFYLVVDMAGQRLEWVRAGHDPAILFDSTSGRLEELKGNGIPLGIDADFTFEVNRRKGLTQGQVVVLSTDGVWEARNEADEIFGKDRFTKLIRDHAHQTASFMVEAIMGAVRAFQAGYRMEDDMTLVVIKAD